MKVFVSFLAIIMGCLTIVLADEANCESGSKKARKLYDKAYELIRSNQLGAAIPYLREALEADEDFVKAHFLLARISYKQEKFEVAIDHYQSVVDICPDYKSEAYYELAQAQFFISDFKNSSENFGLYLSRDDIKGNRVKKADSLKKKCDFLEYIYDNPVPFNPKPVNDLSTADGEYLPIISPDNELFFFVRNKKRDDSHTTIKGGYVEEFCISRKLDAKFEVGAPLSTPFNQGNNQGGATITINNKEMFLTICDAKDGMGSCDIYYTQNKNGRWQDFKNLNKLSKERINTEYWESQVSIAPDGNTLYFSSDRPGGYGGKDIYKSIRTPEGNWSKAFNLGPEINTPFDEKSPFIHVDNYTLYFSSQGHDNIGGFDIFLSRMDDNFNWQKPVNLGHPINSEADDLGFFVSTDGKKGYFTSNKMKGEGGWDIYGFDLYEGARPKKVLFLKGEIKDEEGNVIAGASIEIKDMKTNEITEIEVDSITGEYVYTQTLETDQMLTVTKKDYFYNSQHIKKDDSTFQAPKKIDFKLKKLEVGASFTMDNILFETDSYVLPGPSKQELDNMADYLMKNPNVRIAIQGHTDNIGNAQSNLELSANRAREVHDYLLTKRVNSEQIEHQGFGETQPIASNQTAKGRALNRRTEIKILAK